MSRERLKQYFQGLGEIILFPNFHNQPWKIWNMDETGMTPAHKPSKVLRKKGAKAIHGKTSTSRELITVIAYGNFAGDYLPPHFVFPGKTNWKIDGYDIQSTMERSSSIKGANFSVSDSGWIIDGIVKLWFTKTFLKNTGPPTPQLLICNWHGSHNNIEFVELVEQRMTSSSLNCLVTIVISISLKGHLNTAIEDVIKGWPQTVPHTL